jgi:hypothetical protein
MGRENLTILAKTAERSQHSVLCEVPRAIHALAETGDGGALDDGYDRAAPPLGNE